MDSDLLLGRKYSFVKRGIIKRELDGDIELIVTSIFDAEENFTQIDNEDDVLNMYGKIVKKGLYLESPYQVLLKKRSCNSKILKDVNQTKDCNQTNR